MTARRLICIAAILGGGCVPEVPVLPVDDSGGSTAAADSSASAPTDTGSPTSADSTAADGEDTSTSTSGDTEATDTSDTETVDFCGRPEPAFAFAEPEVYEAPPGAETFTEIAIGDIVAGQPVATDLAVKDTVTPSILVYRGQGMMSGFVFEGAVPLVDNASGVTIAELDEKAPAELIVLDRGNWAIYDDVGPGAMPIAAGSLPKGVTDSSSIIAADVFGDDTPEIAIHAGTDSPDSLWVLSDPLGSAQIDGPFAAGNDSVRRLRSGDIDGDGRTDLLVVHPGWDGAVPGVDIAYNRSDAAPAFDVVPLTTAVTPTSVVARDLNGDGRDDLVLTHAGTKIGDRLPDPLHVYLANKNGDLVLQTPIVEWSTAIAIDAGDFNCDGHQDLVVALLDELVFIAGDGAGGFDPTDSHSIELGAIVGDLRVHDFNLDGRPDVVAGFADDPVVYYFESA